MTADEIEAYLQEPLVAVLSVSRGDKGPLAFPVWFEFRDGAVWITTSPESTHGRLLWTTGRATITVRSETYGDTEARQRYVTAEGPITFTVDAVEPMVRRLRRRYYAGPRVDDWVNRPLGEAATAEQVVVIRPDRISGFDSTTRL